MSRRISIDVTDQEHRKLKAMAALQGKSIKDFVLDRTIGGSEVDGDLIELERVLRKRVEEAQAGPRNKRTVKSIFQEARHKAAGTSPDA